MKKPMRTLTFYSFKGGSGRSVSTLNMLPFLVQKMELTAERPAVVVDFDLDSAGITYILDLAPKYRDSKFNIGNILNEGLIPKNDSDKKEFFGLREVNVFDNSVIEKLKVLGFKPKVIEELMKVELDEKTRKAFSNAMNKEWAVKPDFCQHILTAQELLDTLPAQCLYDISSKFKGLPPRSVLFLGMNDRNKEKCNADDATIETSFDEFIKFCDKMNVGLLIFDSASGRQGPAMLAHYSSDLFVYCLRLTRQFRDGTINQLGMARRLVAEEKRGRLDIVLLPCGVPDNGGREDLVMSQASAEYALTAAANKERINDMFEVHTSLVKHGIPEINIFKWREDILFNYRNSLKSDSDEDLGCKAFETAASEVVRIIKSREEG